MSWCEAILSCSVEAARQTNKSPSVALCVTAGEGCFAPTFNCNWASYSCSSSFNCNRNNCSCSTSYNCCCPRLRLDARRASVIARDHRCSRPVTVIDAITGTRSRRTTVIATINYSCSSSAYVIPRSSARYSCTTTTSCNRACLADHSYTTKSGNCNHA